MKIESITPFYSPRLPRRHIITTRKEVRHDDYMGIVVSLQTLARIFHELLSRNHKDSEVLHYEEFPDYEEFPKSAGMKPPGARMPFGG